MDHDRGTHVKLECLRLLATFRLNEAKMQLIWGFVESYLWLSRMEQQRFEEELNQIAPDEEEAIMQLPNMWIEQGMEKGIEQGETRGRRRIIMRQLNHFGPVSDGLRDRIEVLGPEQLDLLADALFSFKSIPDVEQWLNQNGL